MEKRLTRTEMLFSLGFLFMLICAVGAFFYGIKIGSDKTEAKYVPSKHLNGTTGSNVIAYQQQDLVSFYHTVFSPYREFQDEWQNAVDKMTAGLATDPSATFKELSSLAESRYKEVTRGESISSVSPLLADAQTNLLKSLKLFSQAADNQAGSANSLKSSTVIGQMQKDAFYQQAVTYSLQAQNEYYSAMLKWSSSVDPDLPSDYEAPKMMDIAAWKTLPVIIKNKLMAEQLLSRRLLTDYYPQDLSARVDIFIESGQPSILKVKTVQAIIDLLVGTEAVRPGDFSANKVRLYNQQLLPQLPFFIS